MSTFNEMIIKNEEKVLVKYKFWNLNDESPTGEIIKSLGKKGDP